MTRALHRSRWYVISRVIGIILLASGLLWLGWHLLPHNAKDTIPSKLALPEIQPTTPPDTQTTILRTAGISLENTTQQPRLNQEQALFLAGQLNPEGNKARQTHTRYGLLTYAGTTANHTQLKGVPVWMIWYQNIPVSGGDTDADPKATSSTHDLYIFLDATSGNELLSIWV